MLSGISLWPKKLHTCPLSYVYLHASSPHLLVSISCSFIGFISHFLGRLYLTSVCAPSCSPDWINVIFRPWINMNFFGLFICLGTLKAGKLIIALIHACKCMLLLVGCDCQLLLVLLNRGRKNASWDQWLHTAYLTETNNPVFICCQRDSGFHIIVFNWWFITLTLSLFFSVALTAPSNSYPIPSPFNYFCVLHKCLKYCTCRGFSFTNKSFSNCGCPAVAC